MSWIATSPKEFPNAQYKNAYIFFPPAGQSTIKAVSGQEGWMLPPLQHPQCSIRVSQGHSANNKGR